MASQPTAAQTFNKITNQVEVRMAYIEDVMAAWRLGNEQGEGFDGEGFVLHDSDDRACGDLTVCLIDGRIIAVADEHDSWAIDITDAMVEV